MRRAARRDANEAIIVYSARNLGWYMRQIGEPVDFIGCLRGAWYPIEIKDPVNSKKKGKGKELTKQQREFVDEAPGNVLIWRTTDDVVRATNWLLTGER